VIHNTVPSGQGGHFYSAKVSGHRKHQEHKPLNTAIKDMLRTMIYAKSPDPLGGPYSSHADAPKEQSGNHKRQQSEPVVDDSELDTAIEAAYHVAFESTFKFPKSFWHVFDIVSPLASRDVILSLNFYEFLTGEKQDPLDISWLKNHSTEENNLFDALKGYLKPADEFQHFVSRFPMDKPVRMLACILSALLSARHKVRLPLPILDSILHQMMCVFAERVSSQSFSLRLGYQPLKDRF